MLYALELCRELGASDVRLRLDSELVVRQLEEGAVPDGRDFDREIRRRGDGWAVVPRHSS